MAKFERDGIFLYFIELSLFILGCRPLSNAENEVEDVDQVIRDKIKFWEISTVSLST